MPHGVTIWLTGLSGTGKSTIAQRLRTESQARGQADSDTQSIDESVAAIVAHLQFAGYAPSRVSG